MTPTDRLDPLLSEAAATTRSRNPVKLDAVAVAATAYYLARQRESAYAGLEWERLVESLHDIGVPRP